MNQCAIKRLKKRYVIIYKNAVQTGSEQIAIIIYGILLTAFSPG